MSEDFITEDYEETEETVILPEEPSGDDPPSPPYSFVLSLPDTGTPARIFRRRRSCLWHENLDQVVRSHPCFPLHHRSVSFRFSSK